MPTRRDLVIAVVASVVAGAGAGAGISMAAVAVAPSSAPALMRSRIFDSTRIKPEPTKAGERRGVFDAPTATLERFESHVTTLNPGQAPHAAHKHVEEELMIVREGTVEATLNGQPTRVDAGGMIFCASNEMHGLRNVGTTRATYYVVKWFPRDLPKAGWTGWTGRSDGGTK
jgi:XRE family transcriptional regulator, regulator of sulfur utilization